MFAGLQRSRRWRTALVALGCALHAWMAASVSREFGSTYDELPHLTAGYAYWKHGDFRLQPENGNLPQRWAALPLLARKVMFPDVPAADERADVSAVGRDFFFKLGNDPASLLAHGRWMIALLSAGLCALVFAWARSLFGETAGWVALGLTVFSPAMLAHAGLVTSDLAAAAGFTAASLAWWRLCHRVSVARLVLAGGAAGALALAKFSAALFAPVAALVLLVRLLRPTPLIVAIGSRRFRLRGAARAGALAAAAGAAALVAVALIWGAYGFKYAASPHPDQPAKFLIPWPEVMLATPPPPPPRLADGELVMAEPVDRTPGMVQRLVSFARPRHLLPEAYLYGLALVDRYSRARLAYFAGEYRSTGWVEFFPTAFLLKTTLPALALMLLGTIALATGAARSRHLYRAAPLLVLLAVYWGFSLQSSLNIGHRHLLPIYPASFVLAAASAVWLTRHRRVASACLLGLLGWHGVASLAIRPYYLAYFNPLAGGPDQAHRLFVDSSLDWGQDLPGLRRWLETHAAHERVYLSYFGSDEPRSHGIRAIRFGDQYFDAPRPMPALLDGGVYCISATMYRRVYTHVRGPWSESYERVYRRLDAWLRHLAAQPAGSHPTDLDGSPVDPAEVQGRIFDYEQLQFGRLCHLLQTREPDATVGYSILIYRLSGDDVRSALHAPLAGPAISTSN